MKRIKYFKKVKLLNYDQLSLQITFKPETYIKVSIFNFFKNSNTDQKKICIYHLAVNGIVQYEKFLDFNNRRCIDYGLIFLEDLLPQYENKIILHNLKYKHHEK